MKSPSQARETTTPAEPFVRAPERAFSGPLFVLLLIAAIFASFPKVLLGLDTFFYRDFGGMCYPHAFYERARLLQGELPLWDPYNYCGIPFMALWGAWYPSYFLITLFPMPWSLNFFHLLHLVWGGCGTYWIVRRCGAGSFAAAFAGFAYVFNGVTLSCLMWISYTAFLAWSPWVLGCTVAAWRQGGRWVPLAGGASAMQVLAGAPELTVLFWGLTGLLWLRELWSGGLSLRVSLARLAGVVALGGGISMVQMLPFFDLLAHAQRDLSYGTNKWAMPPWGWANLLVPLFHCHQAPQGSWFQPGQDLVASYYLGAGVLALAACGAWLSRRSTGVVLGGMALLCWILALGSNGVVLDWVKQACPWIGIARYPVKFALFPVLLAPVLAASALDKVVASSNRSRVERLLAGLGLVVIILMAGLLWYAHRYAYPGDNWEATLRNAFGRAVLAIGLLAGCAWLGRLNQTTARFCVGAALLAVLPVDTFTHSPNLFPTVPASTLAPGAWAASGRPIPRLGEGRLMLSPRAESYFGYNSVSNLVVGLKEKRLGEAHSLNLLDEVPTVGGAMILRLAWFERLRRLIYGPPRGSSFGSGLADFLSAAWYSSSGDPTLVEARTTYLPMITGGQRPVFAPDDQALQAIAGEGFNPREVVYLPEAARPTLSVRGSARCTITNIQFTPHRVIADVEASAPCLVVLSQAYYHLWRPSVDGQPVALLRANFAFQALEVTAGNHHVTLIYRDNSFRLGAVISVFSLGVGLFAWFMPRNHEGRNRFQAAIPSRGAI